MFKGTITNAPHIHRLRVLKDVRAMIRNPVSVFERYREEFGSTFTFHLGVTKPAIVSTDPDFIQHVLQKNHTNYNKSDIQTERMAEFQGQGLLNSHGDAWFRQRRFLAKGFLRSRLATLLPLQHEVMDEAMAGFAQRAEQGPVDIYHEMVEVTLKLVGKSLFGRLISDKELQFTADAVSEVQAFIVRQIVQPYLIPWFRLSGQSDHYQKIRIAGDQLISAYIDRRRSEGGNDSDLLKHMLETPLEDTGQPMTESQVLIETLQLLIAGNETSSNGLTWTFYLLAKPPEYIGKIRAEIESATGDGPLDFKALHGLGFTLQVIEEALRLYPPFWMIDRTAMGEDEINGIKIHKGMTVIPYLYGVHRNPDHWADPETFDPSRFERGAVKARHGFAHLPFGGGPRVCIGSNMAMMQILLILISFVRDYDFEFATDHETTMSPMMILRPDGPIKMHFRRVR